MRFLFVEPYYGGSHREFADGWREHSRHSIELLALPARLWKWRMRGAALSLAARVQRPEAYDGLIATSMLSLAELQGIWGRRSPPALLYFHENQITYPVPRGESRDVQFAFTNISSALSASRVLFNSHFHRRSFLQAARATVRMMPDHRPRWAIAAVEAKSSVLYPGCRFPTGPASAPKTLQEGPPLVVWNHRWEFDKDPESFFAAVYRLAARGVEFRLALLGENSQASPKPFLEARERLGERIAVFGYVADRRAYYGWLRAGTLVVSTALQENFGMAVVEAVRLGCFPLLPRRLSYPELLPPAYHESCLYEGIDDLVERMEQALRDPEALGRARTELADAMERFSWQRQIEAYDAELDRLASLASLASPASSADGTRGVR